VVATAFAALFWLMKADAEQSNLKASYSANTAISATPLLSYSEHLSMHQA
jgi:hypothetical protein